MFEVERTSVKTEAQRERERLAQQAVIAKAQTRQQAEEARQRLSQQAKEARSSVGSQAEEAKGEAEATTALYKAEVRGMQSQAEREAEAAKGRARQAQGIELRKQDLPITKPQALTVQSYITDVERARVKAHAEGRTARDTIERIRDSYFDDVNKAEAKALDDIAKEEHGINAEILSALAKANADITKQLLNLSSGVNEWEADSLQKIAQAETDYNIAVAEALNKPGEVVFAELQTDGKIPQDAIFMSYDKTTGEVAYRLLDTRTADEVFNAMITAGDIPKDAILDSFNVETQELTYVLPSVEPVVQQTGLFAIDESRLTGEIFGIKNPGLERAAAQINKLFEIFAPRVEASLFTDPRQFVAQTAKVVVSYMPLVWAINWQSMSKEEKIINGAIDAVILVTLGLGQGLRALKVRPIVKAATVAGRAADTMGNAVKVLAATPMDDVARYAKVSSTASQAIQASKVADAKFIVQLEKVKSLTVRQLGTLERVSGIKGLKSAVLKVSKAQAELSKAWKPVKSLKLGGREYIGQMTKVATAQSKLATALETFNSRLKPRYTFTASPEFKGFATEWRKQILPTFTGGQPVVAPLGRGGKGVQLAVLEKTTPKLELQTVYQMKMKPVYTMAETVTAKVAAPTLRAATEAIIAKVAMSGAARQLAGASPEPVVVKKVQTIIDKATKQAIDLYVAGNTASQVYSLTEANIKAMVETIPQKQIRVSLGEKTAIQIMAKEATKTATKVATQTKVKTTTQEKTRLETKTKIRPTITVNGKERPMTDAELAGAAAWKQGFTYIMRYPPYGKENIQYSSKPFPGVKTLEGIGSAYKTIVRLGGKLPATIKTDMGIMDIAVRTGREGKPVLSFELERGHRPRRFTPRRPIARRRKSELQLSIAR